MRVLLEGMNLCPGKDLNLMSFKILVFPKPKTFPCIEIRQVTSFSAAQRFLHRY